MLDTYRSHHWEFCLLRTLGSGFSFHFVSSITRRVIRREVRRTCLAGARWVDKKESRSRGEAQFSWSRAWGWGTAASWGGREPEREERGWEGLRGEETNFVFCFEIYKAVVELRKLIISFPRPWLINGLKINDCIAVLCTTPRSHHSEKTNYKQSLCLGRKKENSSLFANSEVVATALLKERHRHTAHTPWVGKESINKQVPLCLCSFLQPVSHAEKMLFQVLTGDWLERETPKDLNHFLSKGKLQLSTVSYFFLIFLHFSSTFFLSFLSLDAPRSFPFSYPPSLSPLLHKNYKDGAAN